MAANRREAKIIRAGIAGILANLMLSAFKFTVGILSNSIAIVLDGVNNASDMLSSLITVIGAKMAQRPADREHPLGHGRMEYLSALIVASVILFAGLTALWESAQKIIYPADPDYHPATFWVIGVAIAVKLVLGFTLKNQGKKLNSDALVNSGKDALLDAVIAASTLLAAVVFLSSGINPEAWLGVLIALVIIRAGVAMFRETVSKLLGERVSGELSRAVKQTVCETEGVSGAYDLILNSYGPDRWLGSVNIEVPDTWTADRIDDVCREISARVARRNRVILSSIGIYSRNSTDDTVKQARTEITEIVMAREYVLQIHGFYCDTVRKIIRFDLVIDFRAEDPQELCRKLSEECKKQYPDYEIEIHPDSDYSD